MFIEERVGVVSQKRWFSSANEELRFSVAVIIESSRIPDLVDFGSASGEVAGTDQGKLTDFGWRHHQGKTAFAHELERQLHEAVVEQDCFVFEVVTAKTRDARTTIEIEQIEARAELDMIFRFKVELPWLALTSELKVRLFTTDWCIRCRNLRYPKHELSKLLFSSMKFW